VTNAVEASEGRPRLKISAGAWGRYAIVTVTDWGRGFAPGLRKSVLEEPASNKQGGMGIGLLLSRAIVLDHGGRIWFGDYTEGGTVFKLTVPLAI
jgi:signal transduction histidine kinase